MSQMPQKWIDDGRLPSRRGAENSVPIFVTAKATFEAQCQCFLAGLDRVYLCQRPVILSRD